MLYFARWKIILVLLACLAGIGFTAPNFVAEETALEIPEWLPRNQINLGLDLQGGLHLLLEVDVDAVIADRMESIEDEIRAEFREARVGYRGLGAHRDYTSVQIRKPEEFDRALELIKGLAAPVSFNPLTGLGGGLDLQIQTVGESGIEVRLTEAAVQERKSSALDQVIEVIRRRIDQLGTREPTIQRQGSDRILIQVPGLQDSERVKSIIQKTAKMAFRLVDVSTSAAGIRAGGRTPPGSELLESDERGPDGEAADYFVVRKRVMVSGERLVDAQPTTDGRTGEPVVSFRFDSAGAKKFGKATQDNVNRPFAIVLDNKVVSAPVIREPILGGTGQISGNFTYQEVNDLAVLLRAGALAAPVSFLEERTVGPALGADSIAAGKIASIIGFVLVMIFMVVAYGTFGIAADVALVLNMFLIVGALSALGATLTLPGIAGIVLTIGMAVDANVLVFERIREEVRTGKTPFNAMEAGYRRAIGTILDANITTFVAAAILFAMGSGPVKGFAVTLAIGIVTSVFTAMFLTRMMLVLWLRRARPRTLPI